jgi:hypothetical protein
MMGWRGASYNNVASNAAKAFIIRDSFNTAAVEINKLTPVQVYDKLCSFPPGKKTRNTVGKVFRWMEGCLKSCYRIRSWGVDRVVGTCIRISLVGP